jgi:AI-2 transport protein TqsA
MGNATMPRSIIVLLAIVGVVVLGIGTKAAAGIIAPTMLALVLTIAVLPVGRWARRHGWPSWLATLASLAAAYLILLVMLVGTVVCLIKFVDILPSYAADAKDLTKSAEDGLSNLGLSTSTTTEALSKLDPTKLADSLGNVISSILDAVGGLFFLVTLIFFFVAAVPGFAPRVTALQRFKPGLAAALAKFLRGSQTYLLLTALFGAIVGVLDAGALWLIGVALPLVWGFFSFLTNFIPNIGFIIGVIPPALLGLLVGGWKMMVAVLVVYIVLNTIVQSLIQPMFTGDAVGLSTTITFVSLLFWAWILGPLGALLAIPATLFVKAVLVDCDPGAKWVDHLIGTVGPEEPRDEREPDEPARTPNPPVDTSPRTDGVPVRTVRT